MEKSGRSGSSVLLLQTCGELLLSPVGLSVMTKLAPARLVGLVMGIWFLAAALGNKLAGVLAGEFKSDIRRPTFRFLPQTSPHRRRLHPRPPRPRAMDEETYERRALIELRTTSWLYLLIAAALEIVWASGLKSTDGFTETLAVRRRDRGDGHKQGFSSPSPPAACPSAPPTPSGPASVPSAPRSPALSSSAKAPPPPALPGIGLIVAGVAGLKFLGK